jgi:hypothetical protein
MERSMSVNPGPGEQSLTPGEQRILILMEQGQQRLQTLMEQGQQRLEQRMERMEQSMGSLEEKLGEQGRRLNSLEEKLGEQGQQLRALTIKVEEEAADSVMRDRQLSVDLENLRKEAQERNGQLLVRIDRSHQETLDLLDRKLNTLRNDFSERFNQHNTRLKMLEQTVRLFSEQNLENSKRMQALTEEVQNLAARLELKADA